jgi:histidinol-phosphate aminotransferase
MSRKVRRTMLSSQSPFPAPPPARSPRFRQVLDEFAPYKPGKAPQAPRGRSFKLSSNESPFGPLPSVLKLIAESAATVNRYPDNGAAELTEAIAGRFGVPPEHVAVGCGSVGVCQQLLEAVGEPGAEVIYAWRSFEAYPLLTDLAGAVSVQVPLRDACHELAAMADAITGRTRLIFVCNPNNPTGTVVHRAELAEFLDRVPRDCLVVLDEAYTQYVRDPQVPDGIQEYRDRPNVAVLRTFSKAYGLAGLRVGFLIGHPPVAAAARKTMLPFTVNSLAQAAAVASLAAESELLERVGAVIGERDRVRAELLARGWTVPPTEANFVWLSLGPDSADFAEVCERSGISIRPFGAEGARVTIGEPAANDAFLAVAGAYPRRH